MQAQDAPAVNMVYSAHLHVANAEVGGVQILQSSLTKMTAKMSKRVTWKWKHENHKIIWVPCETLLDNIAREYSIFENTSSLSVCLKRSRV